MKRIIFGLVVVIVASVGVLFLTQQPAQAASKDDDNKDEKEKKVMVYNVTTTDVESRELSLYVESTATLRADRQIDIFAKTAGQVVKINHEEGDFVEEGQVLLELEGESNRLELEQSRVNLRKAELEYERIKESFAKKLVSAEEHDRRKFDYESAQSAFDLAEYKASLTSVYAPFSGTVIARFVELGQTIQPTERLFNLANLKPLEAEVFVPEAKADRLAVGQSVHMSRDDRYSDDFLGKVIRIAPVVDRETGTVKVTVAAHKVPDTIRPGSYVHLRIVIDTMQVDRALPKKAIVFDSRQNASVFVIEAGEKEGERKVRRVEVALGAEEAGYVAVSDGLEPGQTVVLTGKEALKDGSLVKES